MHFTDDDECVVSCGGDESCEVSVRPMVRRREVPEQTRDDYRVECT